MSPGVSRNYGLGYTTMYYPMTPSVADMIVGLISLQDPHRKAAEVIDAIEDRPGGSEHPRDHSQTCRKRDQKGYEASAEASSLPTLQLECVYDALMNGLFAKSKTERSSTSALGQIRGALVDFLYHYKQLVFYHDEFDAYREPMAADTLDANFGPIADAFSADILVLQDQLQKQIKNTLKGEKIDYGLGGVVSLRVLGNEMGKVSGATQNYFDATPVPTLNDVFANLKEEWNETLPSLVTSLAPAKTVELLTALGKTLAVKPATAHLGRGLEMQVTAHTLSGAAGAELELSVKATEEGAGITRAGESSKADDSNSRVSQHTMDTHVRIESLRQFNISTLATILTRGRKPWKPIDPVFEIPLLGLVIHRERLPDRIHAQSLIFIDALIVPTAADLGFGVPITPDQMQTAPGVFKQILSWKGDAPELASRIFQYHQAIVDCLNREYIGEDEKVHVILPSSPNSIEDCSSVAAQPLSSFDALEEYAP